MTGSSKVLVATIALILGLGAPLAAQDGTGIGFAPVGGINLDAEELFVGVEVWVPVAVEGAGGQISFVPAIMFYPFVGGEVAGVDVNASLWSLGVDAAWEFEGESFAPFVRAGPTLLFESSDDGTDEASDTSFRLNLGAGGFFGAPSPNRPFAGIGVLFGDGSALYGLVGYRFTVGGGG